MKLIILAAGEGTRLRPLTIDRPKCMVEFKGKPIIDYILSAASKAGINDITVITGYKHKVLEKYLSEKNIKFYHNPDYDKTNMVTTLFCAAPELQEEDVIISYADIIFGEPILSKLVQSEKDLSVMVDKDWRTLWQARMDDPLSDAETMKINDDGNIIELGKKAESYQDIEGQYIGLVKISGSVIGKVKHFYHSLDKEKMYDGKDFDNMYMTSFLQLIINRLMPISAVEFSGGWLEIDSIEDLNRLNKYVNDNPSFYLDI